MQFGLRTLFAVSTLVAVCCALFFAVPLVVEVPILALLVLVAPSVWVCGACFAKGPWRAFFLGGIVASIGPHLTLVFYGLTLGIGVIGDYSSLNDVDNGYPILLRLGIAGAFLFPGFIAILGGICGALVYRWFGAETATKPASPTSRLHEPYVLLESRVTPLQERLAAATMRRELAIDRQSAEPPPSGG